MTAFQRDALQDFVDDGAKDHPPVFVGREDLLGEILTNSRRALARVQAGKQAAPGNAIIIQGAPGAGKSSVLHELKSRSDERDTSRTVVISNAHLQRALPNVLRALAFAGAATQENWLRTVSQHGDSWIQKIGQVSAFGFGVGLKDSPDTTPPQDLLSLEEQAPAETWQMPVILAVDEAQRLPLGTDTPHALFLQIIHDAATSLPITLVCAGLGDTQSRLRDLGLTHGVRAHALGCLTLAEYTELLDRFCARFGMKMGACRERVLAVVHTTDGWPRHVHWAQQALAEAALAPDVEGDLDRITDWHKVQARSDGLRHGYYATQFSTDMDSSRLLVGRVMFAVGKAQRLGQSLPRDKVVTLVETYAGSEDAAGWRIPKGYDSESYVTHLVHCGALQMDSHSRSMTCPIPSFQSYIIRQGDLDPGQLPSSGRDSPRAPERETR